MPFRRILVLQSVEDAITDRRKRQIQQNSLLKDYAFEHCYAIELNAAQKILPIAIMMDQVFREELNENDLVERLAESINVFKPDILIVFFGAIFEHFAPELISALKILKSRFPQLQLGIHHPQIPASQIPEIDLVFDCCDEIRELIEQMFPRNQGKTRTFPFSQN